MTGFGRKWRKWCNSTVSKNPRQLCYTAHNGLLPWAGGGQMVLYSEPTSLMRITRKGWCSPAECKLRSSDITPALYLFWPLTGVFIYSCLSCRQCHLLFTHVHLLSYSSRLDLPLPANQSGRRCASLDNALFSWTLWYNTLTSSCVYVLWKYYSLTFNVNNNLVLLSSSWQNKTISNPWAMEWMKSGFPDFLNTVETFFPT